MDSAPPGKIEISVIVCEAVTKGSDVKTVQKDSKKIKKNLQAKKDFIKDTRADVVSTSARSYCNLHEIMKQNGRKMLVDNTC